MRAFIIVDLGFGDAGKGLLTDYLVRESGAKLVVRYNGGAQAGHNVVTADGRHHTFSQFGAGTFVPGVRTFLSRHTVVHPTALLVESRHLASVGVTDAVDRIRISGDALVATPYHQELGRLREIARGIDRHGSCGVGIGETVGHARSFPDDAIRFADLSDHKRLRRQVTRIRDYARAQSATLGVDLFGDEGVADRWIDATRPVAPLAADDREWWRETEPVVLEGAQGVLLDEWHGFHPHTSWSDCTVAPAFDVLPADASARVIGVLRAYAVRHGAGPFPTETTALPHPPAEHNSDNEWQGAVRRGCFDGVLTRYAIAAAGRVDALAITHLDWLSHLDSWTYCDGYAPEVVLRAATDRSLERQERLGRTLRAVRPLLQQCAPRERDVIECIEALTGVGVEFGSRGPTAADVVRRSDAHAPSAVASAAPRRSR